MIAKSSSTITQIVGETWADVLGLAAVDPDDDFFELGGHSLMAASAMARLSERIGRSLPVRAIFEAPTPAEMAELIAELDEDEPISGRMSSLPTWAVPLQRQGTGRPVFVFPAGHDEMRALAIDAQIAAHVGRERPFIGFRREDPALYAVRQDGITALARAYIDQMRAMQDDGPFLLMGNCAGGYLAWEVAKCLQTDGDHVAGLFFYEVPLRPDFDRLMPGFTPAETSREWLLTLFYRPEPLLVDLTHVMTDEWQAHNSWAAWERVVLGTYKTATISTAEIGARLFLKQRQQIIANYVRHWLEAGDEAMRGRPYRSGDA